MSLFHRYVIHTHNNQWYYYTILLMISIGIGHELLYSPNNYKKFFLMKVILFSKIYSNLKESFKLNFLK